VTPGDEAAVIAALRAGDEAAFGALVDTHSPVMLHVALAHAGTRAVAEEIVQETWIAVIRGLDRFEGRSSLRTWMLRICANLAMKGGARERRSVPFASLPDEPAVPPERFLPGDHPRWAGHWALAPAPWPTPEEGLLAGETRAVIVAALETLPAAQRSVVALRDIAGCEPEEVSELLGISRGNQRVLLHRARSRLREEIERHHGAVEAVPSDA
jgi:RNA polymerase sigma-70 factor, ECF subfamily